MIYKVTANYQEDKLEKFFKRLTDGNLINQKPDGTEIIASMKGAKITSPETIEWYQTCYCSIPLHHERETVYDQFLIEIKIQKTSKGGKIESFWNSIKDIHK